MVNLTVGFSVLLALLVQIAVVAYWGGRIAKSVERHDRAIEKLEARWNDGLAGLFQRGVVALEALAGYLNGRS